MWRLYTVWRSYDNRWLTGLWSTQAKVEGIVPKAAWHCSRVNSAVNDPFGEPGHTPLYICLPSAWGSLEGDIVFFLIL